MTRIILILIMYCFRTNNIALFVVFVLLVLSQSIFPQGLLRIKENGLWGYINYDGKVVIKPAFAYAGNFSEGLAPVRVGGYYGYIDTNNEFVIQPQYEYADEFHNGIAVVGFENSYNYINKENQILLDAPNNFAYLSPFKENAAVVSTYYPASGYRKYGLVDRYGKLILDTAFGLISDFHNGIATINTWKDYRDTLSISGFGVIDSTGKFIVPFGRYKSIGNFSNGFAFVTLSNNKVGVIDTKGDLILEIDDSMKTKISGRIYDSLMYVSLRVNDEKQEVKSDTYENTYTGLMNLKGELVVNNPEYRYIGALKYGRAFANLKKNNKYALIDKKGNRIGNVEFEGETINRVFQNDYCMARLGGRWGVIDTNGRFLFNPKFKDISYDKSANGSYFFMQDTTDANGIYEQHWGLANLKGETLVSPLFERFNYKWLDNNIISVVSDRRAAYIDSVGKFIWREQRNNIDKTRRLNIDFMLNHQLSGYSFKDKKEYYSIDRIYPETIPASLDYNKDSLSILICTNENAIFKGKYESVSMYVVNATSNDVKFPCHDNVLYVNIQALDKSGNWVNIEDPTTFPGCGNVSYETELAQGYSWCFMLPVYEGIIRTKLRAQILYRVSNETKTAYSNEIETSLNPGQFWRKVPPFYPDIFDFTEYY